MYIFLISYFRFIIMECVREIEFESEEEFVDSEEEISADRQQQINSWVENGTYRTDDTSLRIDLPTNQPLESESEDEEIQASNQKPQTHVRVIERNENEVENGTNRTDDTSLRIDLPTNKPLVSESEDEEIQASNQKPLPHVRIIERTDDTLGIE